MNPNAFDEHVEVLTKTRAACAEQVELLISKVSDSLAAGGKILFFGNGGSASDALHFATELSVRFVKQRRALAGLALGGNVAETTSDLSRFSRVRLRRWGGRATSRSRSRHPGEVRT